MRNIIKLPIEKDRENTDMIVHYELMAMSLQKVLAKIVEKIKKDIQQTDGDKVSIYEISLTLFTIINQTSYFVFSELDLVRAYNQGELTIKFKK